MTRRRPVLLAKEVRALIVPAVACAAPLFAVSFDNPARTGSFAFAIYVAGVAFLGAHAFGHDFAWRTTDMQLAQPVSRSRTWATKMATLGGALVPLALLSWVELFSLSAAGGNWGGRLDAWLLPLAGGLCVAPWLALATRSVLTGTVLSLAAGFFTSVAGELVAVAALGSVGLILVTQRVGWLFLCGIGAVETWRAHRLLEATGVAASAWRGLPTWIPARTEVRPSSRGSGRPLVALVTKELRLHGLAAAMAAMFVPLWAAWMLLPSPATAVRNAQLWQSIVTLYLMVGATLIGSVPSAEERHLGTLASDLSLPTSRRERWTIKVIVAVALSLSFIVGLPAILDVVSVRAGRPPGVPPFGELAALAIPLTIAALYASSVTTGALRALVALALAAASAHLLMLVGGSLIHAVLSGAVTDVVELSPGLLLTAMRWLPEAGLAVASLLALILAGRNHHDLHVSNARVASQLVILGLVLSGAAVAESLRAAAIQQRIERERPQRGSAPGQNHFYVVSRRWSAPRHAQSARVGSERLRQFLVVDRDRLQGVPHGGRRSCPGKVGRHCEARGGDGAGRAPRVESSLRVVWLWPHDQSVSSPLVRRRRFRLHVKARRAM